MHTVEYETFVCSGQKPGVVEGQPVIFRHPDLTVETTATMYLYDRCIRAGNRPSVNTWRSAADAITSWLNFCVAAGISVESADEEDLKTYRDEYLHAISPRGAPYSPKTVALRIGFIQEYCHYLAEHRLYHGDINATVKQNRDHQLIDTDPLAHLNKRIQGQSKKSKIKPKIPDSVTLRPAGPNDLRALMNWAEQSSAPQRNGLIFKIGWVCGLRKEEALGLKYPEFLGITTDPEAPNLSYEITVQGKGKKTRKVAFPGWLIDEINEYIEDERAKAVTKGQSKKRLKNNPLLLLVGMALSKTPGKPITESRIKDLMGKACSESGLVETATYQDPKTGQSRLISQSKYSYHSLRHTYACLTYHLEKRAGNPEPWKKIQAQLGHKHLQTTIDTYLNWVELFAPSGHNSPDYRSIF